MKKLILFLVIGFMFSCGDDSNDIVGTYKIVEFKIECSEPEPTNISLKASNGCLTVEGSMYCLEVTLNADGTGSGSITSDGDVDEGTFTYTINEGGDKLTLCDGGDCFDIEVSGDQLLWREIEDDCTSTQVLEKI